MQKPNLLSYTQFITYLKNPKLYKKIYIDNEPIPETPIMAAGKKFHEFHKFFWENVKIIDRKIAIDIPRDYNDIEQKIKNLIYLEQWRVNFLIEQGKSDIIKPVFIEKSLESERLGIQGVIDRIEKGVNDNYGIIDLKLSHVNPEHILQLYFYKILCDEINLHATWGAVFSGSREIKYIIFDEKTEKELINLINFVKSEIKNRNFESKRIFKFKINGEEFFINSDLDFSE